MEDLTKLSADVSTLLCAITTLQDRIAVRSERIAELEALAAELEQENAYLRVRMLLAEGYAPDGPAVAEYAARIAKLEARLDRWRDWAGAHECNAYVTKTDDALMDSIDSDDMVRDKRVAELEAQLREVLHGKSYGYSVTAQPETANDVVSTAELSAYEISVADAHGALDVNADCLGFVKREWLDRHRASVAQQRKLLAEPAERKAQEEDRRYGRGEFKPFTLSVLIEMHYDGSPAHEALCHLRETLATLDAVRALAEKYKRAALPYDIEAELLEVLNGKR